MNKVNIRATWQILVHNVIVQIFMKRLVLASPERSLAASLDGGQCAKIAGKELIIPEFINRNFPKANI